MGDLKESINLEEAIIKAEVSEVEELPECIFCGKKLEDNSSVRRCNATNKFMCDNCVSSAKQFSKCTGLSHGHSLVIIKLLSTAVAEKL